MNNFYRIQNRHHLLYRGFFLTVAVLLLLLVSAASVSAYSLNGTATGNLLVNGYAAEADGLSVYADTENGYALTLSAADGDIVADPDKGGAIILLSNFTYPHREPNADRIHAFRATLADAFFGAISG